MSYNLRVSTMNIELKVVFAFNLLQRIKICKYGESWVIARSVVCGCMLSKCFSDNLHNT
jgi:hypothetical protein